MDTRETVYQAVSIRLRAPRVAIVIPTQDRWGIACYVALKQCSATLGGAGFILIPHRDGSVDDLFLRLASAYDPDHIVSSRLSIADLNRLLPGRYRFAGADNRPLNQQEIEALSLSSSDELTLSPADDAAVQTVARSCAAFRDPNSESVLQEIDLAVNRLPSQATSSGPILHHRDLIPVADPSVPPEKAPDDGNEMTRLWALSVLGLELEKPLPEAAELASLTYTRGAGGRQDHWTTSPFWAASMQGLTQVTGFRRSVHWLVVGDTAEDFALHHALSRMSLDSMWLPSGWLDPASEYHSVARAAFTAVRSMSFHDEVQLTSLSVTLNDEVKSRLRALDSVITDRENEWLTPVSPAKVPTEVDRRFLALRGNYDRELLLPLLPLPGGDRLLVNRLPALIPENMVPSEPPTPDWVSDVELEGNTLPPGRSITPKDLQTADDPWQERVRLGRDGISVMAQSWGLVLAGSTPRQSVARPRLRFPSLLTVVTHDGRKADREVTISDAGYRANLACALWDSRNSMRHDLYTNIEYFRTFLSSTRSSKERFPDDDGCVLADGGPEAFPTFQALLKALPSLLVPEARHIVDTHLERGILHRGLILQCPECKKGQFVTPEAPDFSSSCRRCDARIPLVQTTWRQPEDEPRWYYSLNTHVRRLLKDNGDVPLLAEAYISQKVDRELHALPELEFKQNGTDTIEIDIFMASRTSVMIGEAKSSPAGTNLKKKLPGLLEAARIVGATEIVLASGDAGTWPEATLERLTTQLASIHWEVRSVPILRLLTGLRTTGPKMQVVDHR